VSLCHYGGQFSPSGTSQACSVLADKLYIEHDGPDAAWNHNGIDQAGICTIIQEIGGHYQTTSPDSVHIHAWIHYGYPVLLEVFEASVYDVQEQRVPYTWNVGLFQHVIIVTGVDADGNFLCHDTAVLQPSPRTYDATKLRIISATTFIPAWIPIPRAGLDPTIESPYMNIPNGWSDDGTILTCPNGKKASQGIRNYVLDNNWDCDNYVLQEETYLSSIEGSNPSLGAGSVTIFRWITLEWVKSTGIIQRMWTGQELLWTQAQLGQVQPSHGSVVAEFISALVPKLAHVQSIEGQLQQALQAVQQSLHT
jgi:hypothetical protein